MISWVHTHFLTAIQRLFGLPSSMIWFPECVPVRTYTHKHTWNSSEKSHLSEPACAPNIIQDQLRAAPY